MDLGNALEKQLGDLEMMVAQSTESERHARAVISSLRKNIEAQMNVTYDLGWDEGVTASDGEWMKGRRV